jgi:hypothetical protein
MTVSQQANVKNQFALNGYDAAGNVMQDGNGAYPCAGNTDTWDAEEQMTLRHGECRVVQ